uniref:Integrator complex subunit 4 n=1 Tax=Schistocephalus solidus TaxID=70667 RepID=A0A183SVW9_SCHSO
LQYGGPNSRLKSLNSLASNVAPNIEIGGHAVAEIILSFCDDGDARVRACALSCLCTWIKPEGNSDESQRKFRSEWITENWVRVYIAACRLITEDVSMVREVSIWTIYYLGLRFPKHETPVDAIRFSGGLLEHASLDLHSCPSVPKFKNSHRKRSVCLVEDAFSRVCDRLQDPSRRVRQLSASLIADLAEFVAEETLMLTLEKTVMSDRQVKRSASDRSAQDKTGLWGPVTAPGRRANLPKGTLAQSSGNAPLSVDSIPLLSTGCTGALINGLEDEFHEVRCATLATVRQITAYSARFASVCQDLLVDMLTDDIQAVRLQAVHALQAVGDQVPILNDQIAIVTSTLAEDSILMRRRLHQLLSRCRLVSPPCLLSLLDGLLSNLRRYPDDRDSIWKCAASVGSRHPAFVEVCVSSLLRTHPWLSDQEPFREDPAYITVLLLVLNALPGAPGMKAHFPRHLAASQAYLGELVPHLLKNIDVDFSFGGKPSTKLCLPAKVNSRNGNDVGICDVLEEVLPNTITPSYFLSVVNRAEYAKCKKRMTGERNTLPGSYVGSEVLPRFAHSGHGELECTSGQTSWRLRDSLCHLCRLIDLELRTCQQQRDRHLGDLPAWLDCLASAGYCFLVAVNCCTAATRPSNVLIKDPERQRVRRFLRRALRLSLKAEFLFIGPSKMEVQAIQTFRGHLLCCLDPSAPADVRKEACVAVSCLTDLFDSLLDSLHLEKRSSADPAFLSSVGRIRCVSAQLLFPPVYGNDSTGSESDSLSTGGCGGASGDSAATDGGAPSLPSASVSLPEIRFTAILATAAVRIHAVFTGFSLEQARERIRVLYRRPDYLQHSDDQDDTAYHSHQKCPLLTWHPPPNSWKPLETLLSSPSDDQHPQLSQLEMQTTLELTAASWTDAATLELGLGLCVPMLSLQDSVDYENDSRLKRRGNETVLPLLPNGNGILQQARVNPRMVARYLLKNSPVADCRDSANAIKDAWMIRKAEEIQGYADRNEMKNFFKAIKAIYGPCIKGSAPLLSSDGTTLLTEKSQILKRWAEHFRSVLNCSSAISDAAIDRLPQVDTNNDLDLPPSLPETIRAVQQISSGKAPGSDAIPPEVYKHGGPRLMAELTTLFQEMWRQGQVPQDFKDATIVHLYKRKGNWQLCNISGSTNSLKYFLKGVVLQVFKTRKDLVVMMTTYNCSSLANSAMSLLRAIRKALVEFDEDLYPKIFGTFLIPHLGYAV